MSKRVIHRILDLAIGLPLLMLGVSAIAIDIVSAVSAAMNQNPNRHAISTFPMGSVLGIPLYLFGYRLVFRTPFFVFVRRLATISGTRKSDASESSASGCSTGDTAKRNAFTVAILTLIETTIKFSVICAIAFAGINLLLRLVEFREGLKTKIAGAIGTAGIVWCIIRCISLRAAWRRNRLPPDDP